MATEKTVATVKPSKDRVPAPAPGRAAGGATGGSPFMQKSAKYLSEVRTELRKTTWPTREELISQTKVVLGLLVLIGVFIAGWDFVLGQIFKALLFLIGVRTPG